MKKYIPSFACFGLFLLVCILFLIFPDRVPSAEATMGSLALAGLCWLQLPTAHIPRKQVSFFKNDFKKIFHLTSCFRWYRPVVYTVAILSSVGSVALLIAFLFELIA